MSWQQVFDPDTRVFWAGFETRLGLLHRSGWKIAVSRSDYNYEERILIRHEGIQGFSQSFSIEDHRSSLLRGSTGWTNLQIHMEFGNTIRFEETSRMTTPMEALPISMGMCYSGSLDDLFMFKEDHEEVILIEEDTVPELLDRIKQLQSPRAKELLREKIVIPDSRTTAKILAFKG